MNYIKNHSLRLVPSLLNFLFNAISVGIIEISIINSCILSTIKKQ